MKKLFWLFLIYLACSANASCTPKSEFGKLPVYPGAQGFGIETPAGRGGKIIKVTNLAEKGKGSLRAALEEEGPRIVVFEVGGIIPLSDDITISSPYVTVAGQTAPSPGILLKGAGIVVAANDVLIQHIRIRCGDSTDGPNPESRDALKIVNPSRNVIIDHISVSWATDENMSVWANLESEGLENITIKNCIISEGLNQSIHTEGPSSKGLLVGNNIKNLALLNNLFAHNMTRNPLVYGKTTMIAANNIFYNSGSNAFFHISDGWEQGPSQATLISNLFVDGPNTPADSCGVKIGKDSPDSKIFLMDNSYTGTLFCSKNKENQLVFSPPVSKTTLKIDNQGESDILNQVGARPADRDTVDDRIVQEVKNRSGKVIDSPSQVGGWPIYKETFRRFNVPDKPGEDDNRNGYTNIEEVLQSMALSVEVSDRTIEKEL